MPITINASRKVGELATEVPGAAQVFQRAGIDFCCGGEKTLDAACAAHGVDAATVVAELALRAGNVAESSDAHWREEPVQDLITHIVKQHHAYVRRESPTLQAWLDKVVQVHGGRHPELAQIRQSFIGVIAELSQHMAKEELLLFPAIARLASPNPPDAQTAAAISAPVQQMIREHDHTGNDLAEMRQASGGYRVPADGCATYRVLFEGLAAFEADMHRHVHLENNILFPRAMAMGGHAPQAA